MADVPGFTPLASHTAKLSGEKAERDNGLALQVLQEALKANAGKNLTAPELTAYAEELWTWVTG